MIYFDFLSVAPLGRNAVVVRQNYIWLKMIDFALGHL